MTWFRRDLLRLALVGALLAALQVPAGASSAPTKTKWIPRTMASRAVRAGAEGRMPLAFGATHLHFGWRGDEGTGVRYRLVGSDGTPSRWGRAPEDHDAEAGRRHFSGVIVVDHPRSVEYRKIVPSGAGMGPVTLDYVNTLDGAPRRVAVPLATSADATTPRIVTRAEWGADESITRTTGGCKRQFFDVQQLFVHHTAGSNFDNNGAATMRAIQRFHTLSRGWCDVGYNFVIGWNGTIYEGRWARDYRPWEVHNSEDPFGNAVSGAHVSGFNSGSVGISMMGNFSTAQPPTAMKDSLVELLAWEADRHGLKPRKKHTYRNPETGKSKVLNFIAGHRDAGFTACPGTNLYARLSNIRGRVATKVGAGRVLTLITAVAALPDVTYGEPATISGTLTDENGLPLSGRSLLVHRREGAGRWRDDGAITTAADGTFSLAPVPEKNLRLALSYAGDATTWGSESAVVKVGVRPQVTVAPQGGTPDSAGVYHFPPTTTQVLLTGSVAPDHTGQQVRVKVFQQLADGSSIPLADTMVTLGESSTYSYSFAVPQGGGTMYRTIVIKPKHNDHKRGVSPATYFVVD